MIKASSLINMAIKRRVKVRLVCPLSDLRTLDRPYCYLFDTFKVIVNDTSSTKVN